MTKTKDIYHDLWQINSIRNKGVLKTNVAVEKQYYYIFRMCMCVCVGVCHAKSISRIELSSVACLASPYFSTSPHKQTDFRKTLLNIKCVFWFSQQLLSEAFLILSIIQRDITVHVKMSSCNIPVFLDRFFRKSSNFKFYQNPCSRSRMFPCERTEG
jgi:hypothetical protein